MTERAAYYWNRLSRRPARSVRWLTRKGRIWRCGCWGPKVGRTPWDVEDYCAKHGGIGAFAQATWEEQQAWRAGRS